MSNKADESFSSFAAEMKGVRQIKQDKISPETALIKKKSVQKQKLKDSHLSQHQFFFSDEYQPLLPEEGAMRWKSESCDPHELKKLRRGDYSPEVFLDLHGLTQQQAKLEIAALLYACKQQQYHVASIMHGYGQHILKTRVPCWLAQHPQVACFHQAPKEYGGSSALLVMIAHDELMKR